MGHADGEVSFSSLDIKDQLTEGMSKFVHGSLMRSTARGDGQTDKGRISAVSNMSAATSACMDKEKIARMHCGLEQTRIGT